MLKKSWKGSLYFVASPDAQWYGFKTYNIATVSIICSNFAQVSYCLGYRKLHECIRPEKFPHICPSIRLRLVVTLELAPSFLALRFLRKTNWKSYEPKIIQFSPRLLRLSQTGFSWWAIHQFSQSFNQLASAADCWALLLFYCSSQNQKSKWKKNILNRNLFLFLVWFVSQFLPPSPLLVVCLFLSKISCQYNWQ